MRSRPTSISPVSIVAALVGIVVVMVSLPLVLTIIATAVSSSGTAPHPRTPTPAAIQRSRSERRQASAPVLGGTPTVVATGNAWGVQESGTHACRVVLGTAYHGATVTVSVTRYDATDCTVTAGDAEDAARGLLHTLP